MATDNLRELRLLLRGHYPIVYVTTYEETRLERILEGVTSELGRTFFHWTATDGLRLWGKQEAVAGTKDPTHALEFAANAPAAPVFLFKDLHVSLENALIVRKLRDVAKKSSARQRALIVSAPELVLPKELHTLVAHYQLQLPTNDELKALIDETCARLSRPAGVFQAGRPTGVLRDLTPQQFEQFVRSLSGMTLEEAERAIADAVIHDLRLDPADIELVLKRKQEVLKRDHVLELSFHSDGFQEVGGLERLKAWLAKRTKGFTEEAKAFGLPAPRGIILLGVQGCGKSLCAKAVAKEWGLPLLRFDPSRLYDKFIGESERNLQRIFETVKYLSPVVLWIDEIEKGFAFSTSSEADAGLSRRIFGTFITWLQEKTEPVFVVATCNDVSALPPELLRKGRFDELFFVDLPSQAVRKQIVSIHLRKRKKDPAQFDLDALARATERFSGAEIEQVIVNALYAAFSGSGVLTTELLMEEIARTVPLAVTMEEQVEGLRAWAHGRTVPAGNPESS